MIVKMMAVGPLMVNCYIVGDEETGEAAVFDPGGHGDRILEVLEEYNLKIKYIVNTPGDFHNVIFGIQAVQSLIVAHSNGLR